MELKEATEILKKEMKQTLDVVEKCSLESQSGKEEWKKEAQAIDTVLQALEELQKDYISKDKLVEAIDFAINATDSTDDYSIGLCNGMIYVKALLTDGNPDYKKCQNNSISKDKIKEKIQNMKKSIAEEDYSDESCLIHSSVVDTNIVIEYLEELLKGE